MFFKSSLEFNTGGSERIVVKMEGFDEGNEDGVLFGEGKGREEGGEDVVEVFGRDGEKNDGCSSELKEKKMS